MFTKLKIEKNWWTANGILWILSALAGILAVLSKGTQGLMMGVLLFFGGILILIGLALLQKSRVAFWIVMVVAVFTFLDKLSEIASVSRAAGGFSPDYSFLISLVTFVFALMLWQEVKGKKAKK